ncbi:ribonuclease PH [candidate division WOR_3 bacterium SM23_60]|uniref:Ribonuclease PH n=1 Tax=candidate division WOR_3 bacterium SM23_60 TaxID=1703780 RepID=A0A0S8GFV8_UNCW3|nr:MAG: ribonuclease PH [candidate division WOR_3 bacterium SM23_60]
MRKDKRKNDELRKIDVELDYLDHPAGSCLYTQGRTKVLCAVTVENRVPQWIVGKGHGWLTAEYALLPCSTDERVQREANTGKLSGRTQEIRRFIGRSLRPIFDLSLVGERTFIVDCDVIQADGGTRTAAVNGAFIALYHALSKMMQNKRFRAFPILDFVGAVSLGIVRDKIMLDLTHKEDSNAEIDMNIVMTGRGKIIEVQATAENFPVSRARFDELLTVGAQAIQDIIRLEKKIVGKHSQRIRENCC